MKFFQNPYIGSDLKFLETLNIFYTILLICIFELFHVCSIYHQLMLTGDIGNLFSCPKDGR
jgi:uncharacterized membrane protein